MKRAKDPRRDALEIFGTAVAAVMPGEAVRRALADFSLSPAGDLVLVSIGKAAWEMAKTASDLLGDRIAWGCIVTKYGHARGAILNAPAIEVYEAGHPIPDENGCRATGRILEMTASLSEKDAVLFLVSGGGSALFESPLSGISLADLEHLNRRLLASGADIVEINTLRKRFSAVKGGRFALHCAPAHIYQAVLSDVVGDRLDSIASGPAWPDETTCGEARQIAERRGISLTRRMRKWIEVETPKRLDNVETRVTGNVRALCHAAGEAASTLGYRAYPLTTTVDCEARELGRFLSALAREIRSGESVFQPPCAVILGGETVVQVRGSGRGGRNQEAALAAAEGIDGLDGIVVLSGGSDGTDGPTDAAGGIVDGKSWQLLAQRAVNGRRALDENDAYAALRACGGLIVTGPTGTNVNDLILLLCG